MLACMLTVLSRKPNLSLRYRWQLTLIVKLYQDQNSNKYHKSIQGNHFHNIFYLLDIQFFILSISKLGLSISLLKIFDCRMLWSLPKTKNEAEDDFSCIYLLKNTDFEYKILLHDKSASLKYRVLLQIYHSQRNDLWNTLYSRKQTQKYVLQTMRSSLSYSLLPCMVYHPYHQSGIELWSMPSELSCFHKSVCSHRTGRRCSSVAQ